MENCFLISDIFIHIIKGNKYIHDQQNLDKCCKYLYEIYKNLIKDKLVCTNIDIDLISTLLEVGINDVYLSESVLTEINDKLKKYYYSGKYSMDVLMEQCINLFIINNKLDFKEIVMRKSGYYCYYGTDGSSQSMAYLFTAVRYANFNTFKILLKEFSNESVQNSYCDNVYIQYKEFSDCVLDKLIKCEKIDYKIIDKYVILNNKLPLSRGDGNIIDCNLLINISKENKDKSIYESLIQFKNYKFHSIFWYYEDMKDEYDENVNIINCGEINDFLNIGYNGFIVVLPKMEEYELPNDAKIHYRIINNLLSSEIVIIGGVKIYKL
jgi:hypothetical protein